MASDLPPAPVRAPAATLLALKQRQRQRQSQQQLGRPADVAVDLTVTGSSKAYQPSAARPSTAVVSPTLATTYRPSAYVSPRAADGADDRFDIGAQQPQVLTLPSVQVDASQSLVSEPAQTPHPRFNAPVPTPTTTVILPTGIIGRNADDITTEKQSGGVAHTPSRIPVRSQQQRDASSKLAQRHSSASTAAGAAGKAQSTSRKKSGKQDRTAKQDLPSDVDDIIKRFHKILDRQFAPGPPNTTKQNGRQAAAQQQMQAAQIAVNTSDVGPTALHSEEAQLAARATALHADLQNLQHRKLQAEHREQAVKLKQRHAEQYQRAEATLVVQLQSQLLVRLDQRDAAKSEIGTLQAEVQQRLAALQSLLSTLNDKERSVDADYNRHVNALKDRHASEMQTLKQHLDEQLVKALSEHESATTYTPLSEVRLSAHDVTSTAVAEPP